jgi:hypothetical protein
MHLSPSVLFFNYLQLDVTLTLNQMEAMDYEDWDWVSKTTAAVAVSAYCAYCLCYAIYNHY